MRTVVRSEKTPPIKGEKVIAHHIPFVRSVIVHITIEMLY